MNNTTEKELALSYIDSHNVMSIATVGTDGPWSTAVFYISVGFELYFVSSPGSKHCQNMAGNSRVAVTIQEDYSDWSSIKGIQIAGIARPVSKDKKSFIMDRYKEKFSFLRDTGINPKKILIGLALKKANWYCISPDQVFFVDNEKGFGHRGEISIT